MNTEELSIIKQAILNELEGYEFYKLVSEKPDNTKESKEAFLELAGEEKYHIDWLKDLFQRVKDGKENEFKLTEIDAPPAANLFKWENLDRKGAQLAISVFGIGIQMERSAVEFYKKAAADSKIEIAKEFYLKLVEWEKAHLEKFSEQYDTLKEEWWSDQGYAPF